MFYAKDCLKNFFSEEQWIIKPSGRKSAVPEGKSGSISLESVADRRDPFCQKCWRAGSLSKRWVQGMHMCCKGLTNLMGQSFWGRKSQFPAHWLQLVIFLESLLLWLPPSIFPCRFYHCWRNRPPQLAQKVLILPKSVIGVREHSFGSFPINQTLVVWSMFRLDLRTFGWIWKGNHFLGKWHIST